VYTEVNHILRDADIALYRAKQTGPNTLLVLNYKIQQQAIERISLEAELRIAIDKNQLCLHYQPIFAMTDRTLVGFEVLVRWQHPERGLLAPNKFIPLAEESGMIQSLDCWVLKRLDAQWQQWQQRGLDLSHLTFNINLAAVHFQHRDCYCKLDYLLTQSSIPSPCLKLEITETLFVDSSAIALHPMEQLHRKGFKLCIDDFGTGYSSLSRLHSFPVSTLKIDRAFVQNMQKTSGAIVETIIALAHQLNMDVVAEGIETVQQFRQLQQLGCDYGQGFWYSRPLSVEDLQDFLSQGVLVCS
jgi:EAL domain-containing protein (putative c-di-GMP-specific phosphodiesterase class I)